MDDLVAFLRARLDEDEAIVRTLAEPPDWHTGPGDDPGWTDESVVCMWPPEHHTPYEQDKHWRGLTASSPELAAHIARHDPARVLRDIEAVRGVLGIYDQMAPGLDGPDAGTRGAARMTLHILRPALRHLARAYADHPDYRADEWTPEI
ncbi:DUF6221 family protein [Streptomyces sp. NRRL F-5123]|uniref:DUF6221 family protein n=1 Tax=Streptomyces sp. NRRL F-5123 TaxID=1463856 RepID=UPI000694FC6B|nr:DUF6221 family protein [Streptomyces sp. NRRL F-5123]